VHTLLLKTLKHLTAFQAGYAVAAALPAGFSKTSVGGAGILAVLLMALAVAGRALPGGVANVSGKFVWA